MTLVFENDLVAPTLTLTIAYLILSIYASRRLIELHKAAPEMNTRKLFVMTCSLTTILRLMTFGRFVLRDVTIAAKSNARSPNIATSLYKS
jgi:hypothetical protein